MQPYELDLNTFPKDLADKVVEDEESPDEEDYFDYSDYFNFYGDDNVASSSPAEQKAEKDNDLPPEVCFIYYI